MMGFAFSDALGWNEEPEAASYFIVQGMRFGVNPLGVLFAGVPAELYMVCGFVVIFALLIPFVVAATLGCGKKAMQGIDMIYSTFGVTAVPLMTKPAACYFPQTGVPDPYLYAYKEAPEPREQYDTHRRGSAMCWTHRFYIVV